MDYVSVILNGYLDINSRNHLDKYFCREFKKAQENYYELSEFFDGCLNIINQFNGILEFELLTKTDELESMLNRAKDGTIQYSEIEPEKTYDEMCQDTIKYCSNQLKTINLDYGSVQLHQYTNGKYGGHLTYKEINHISNAIHKAKERIENQYGNVLDNEYGFSVLEWATIFYYVDETNLLAEDRYLKSRINKFMSKHKIKTSYNSFRIKYSNAKKRINEICDYPIHKLELIIPFCKENYNQVVTKIENDIIFLKENHTDY